MTVRKTMLLGAILLTWLLTVVPSALALRCGGKIISPGDSMSRVLAFCGEPDSVNSWQEEHVKRAFPSGYYQDENERADRKPIFIKEYVRVEEWTYNHGPYRFIDYLRFENGTLKRIKSGDYGY